MEVEKEVFCEEMVRKCIRETTNFFEENLEIQSKKPCRFNVICTVSDTDSKPQET